MAESILSKVFKLESMTARLLPLLAALLLIGVALAKLGYTQMSATLSTVLTIIAIVGILIYESKGVTCLGKKCTKYVQWAILAVAVLLILAIVPPLMGFAIPIISDYAAVITILGAILALILMVI